MGTSIDCARCGKEMSDRRNQLWCDRCGAFFCGQCAGMSWTCPHCGNEDLGNERKRVMVFAAAIVASAVLLVVLLALGALWWIKTAEPAGKEMSAHDQGDVVVFVVSFPLSMLLLGGFFFYLMKTWERGRQHSMFVAHHSGKEWTCQENPAAGLDGIPVGEAEQRTDPLGEQPVQEWLANGQYFRDRNLMAALFIAALAIFLSGITCTFAIPHINDACTTIAGLGIILGGISMFSIAMIAPFGLSGMPTHVAFSSQGIGLRYRSKRAPRHLLRSIRWSDIETIFHVGEIMKGKPNERTMLIFKVDGIQMSIQLDNGYQRRILDEWCRRNPGSDAATEYARHARPE